MCSQLIGKEYSYGENGEKVDCISLVFQALDIMGIENPGVQKCWYTMSIREIFGQVSIYAHWVDEPTYDGDIVLLASDPLAFGVVWKAGILYINQTIMKVDWKPVSYLSIRRCFRMKGNS
jgi:hypothetical protein